MLKYKIIIRLEEERELLIEANSPEQAEKIAEEAVLEEDEGAVLYVDTVVVEVEEI